MKQTFELSQNLKQLFCEQQLHLWLIGLVHFGNQYQVTDVTLAAVFRDWNIEQQQDALNLFSESKFVDLVNAIFSIRYIHSNCWLICSIPKK
ncbi:MAG: hypothetical protein ACRCXC_04245 [Legionella sp.]